VEDDARAALSDAGILSYRVLWFEDDEPSRWPRRALASVTTHDLPTVAGVSTRRDADDQRDAGVDPDEEQLTALTRRITAGGDVATDDPVQEAVEAAYRRLATAACDLVCASIEDALAVEQRPNVPATTSDDRPNWSIPLPLLLNDLLADDRPRRLATILAAHDGPGSGDA
jgi:4-alpha-glucanotransferase